MNSTEPINEMAKGDAGSLALWLYVVLFELHPCYGNTSRRGRGIDGSTITQQCNVIRPEGWESEAVERAESAIRSFALSNPGLWADAHAMIAHLRASFGGEADDV